MTFHDTIILSCLFGSNNSPETNVQVATASQFFISYTIRTFGALTFAAIMTTRQVKNKPDLNPINPSE